MFKIKNEFIDNQEKTYDIRNVNFETPAEIRNILGDYITLSSPEKENDFELNEDGIYLFKSKYDKDKAIKLYKDYNSYKYTNHNDYVIISELQKRQDKIKLTKFPTGIITIQNKVIGQEIPYYENSDTIFNYFTEGNMKKRPTQFYLEILKILKELCNEGIYYTDIHTKNFLINNVNEIINLIDFEKNFVYLDNQKTFAYSNMINNLKFYMINILNNITGITFDYNYNKAETLEELEQIVLEKDNKLQFK